LLPAPPLSQWYCSASNSESKQGVDFSTLLLLYWAHIGQCGKKW